MTDNVVDQWLQVEAPVPGPVGQLIAALLQRAGVEAGAAAWAALFCTLAVLLIVAGGIHLAARWWLQPGLVRMVRKTRSDWDDALADRKVFLKVLHLLPAAILYLGASVEFAGLPPLQTLVQRLAMVYIVVSGARAISAFLSAVVDIYNRSFSAARERPILSYIQVIKIIVWLFAFMLIISVLLDRSPWVLLGGLGAVSAVLLLVFKDSIMGLVASIQLANNDLLRKGDWIEMSAFGADGEVRRISLTSVRVQNWDLSISTIPTYRLITDGFRNWRAMSETGARRFKRTFHFDMRSVRFLDDELRSAIREVEPALEALESGERREPMTNMGAFREHLTEYLKGHPMVRNDMTQVVRQLEPTERGLPIQIYVFSSALDLLEYESLRAEVTDHVLAAAPEFGLALFQEPTGEDLRAGYVGRTADGSTGH